MLDVMAVLMRKHLIIGWRRKRFLGAGVRAGVLVAVPLVLWFLQHGVGQRENVRGMLAAAVMPILGAVFIVTMFTQFVIEVVTDKELKMRYVQQVAGVSNAVYWSTYYLFYSILTSFSVLLYLLSTMWIAPIYKYSDGFLMFLSFSAAFLQAFFLCIVVSTVFSNARIAGVICSVLGSVAVAGFYALLPLISTRSFLVYFLQSLIPFVSPLSLLTAIGALENPDQEIWGANPPGFTWSSFGMPISAMDLQSGEYRLQPAAGVQFLILLADCLIYGMFAVWFEQVYQGEFGAAKPLTFCLHPAYLCPRRALAKDGGESPVAPALQLTDLVKSFGRHRAVDGMSLEVKRAEIFALLGHNGAGKTTAINCITGMLPITSGSASVCGVDVATELREARRHLSVCPQDNPLYLEHSVEEHLTFFAALRGVPAATTRETISSALEALGLAEKRGARVSTLSGGQKRRLWVATSLLGVTPVVFLDEPTSGMDPANRRKLWDLLVHMKACGRCIIFTTHYLDEADVLAERKAILDQGKVKAVGTSMELKREFGLGYHLRVVGMVGTPAIVQDHVRTLVESHIPSATDEAVRDEDRAQATDAPPTWSFILPFDQTEKIGPMLLDLERRAHELQVADFSMEATTLEEVFMALGQGSGDSAGMESLTVPADSDPPQPVQAIRPETRQQVEVPLPAGVQPGQASDVALPTASARMDLVSPHERVPVTWAANMQAVLALRWRQLFQKPRSLLATMVVPVIILFFSGWSFAWRLQALPTSDGGMSRQLTLGVSGAAAGVWMSVSLAIALPYFATTLVLDRVQRCLHAATSQGLRLSAYWAGTFLSNYLHFLVLGLLLPVCLVAFQAPFYSEVHTIMQYLPAALFCPVPMLLFAYSTSRLFSSTEACSKFMPSISLLAALVPALTVYTLILLGLRLQLSSVGEVRFGDVGQEVDQSRLEQGKKFHQWANIIHWIMCFIDPFYLLPGTFAAIGLSMLSDSWIEFFSYVGVELDFVFPSIAGSHVALPLLGAATLSSGLCLALAWDGHRCRNLLERSLCASGVESSDMQMDIEAGVHGAQQSSTQPDEDVQREKYRVDSASPGSYAVMYKDLVHTYNPGSRREVRAVRGISLGVPPGECFCLLGPNGAGKTTTLDVLTGAIFPPSRGEVLIGQHAVTGSRQERHEALRQLGNCPQVDPLWPTLTGRQHLLFYAKVKGLPPHLCAPQAATILRALGFSDFDADKPTDGYSGGMKRKLSLAIALIGSPPTLLLDEPSAAVDAAAKRHLWRVVKRRGPGQTVVLTTHSMEEAEALSDRLAIQVRGRLRCIGTPDHVKMRHGAGYQLEMLTNHASQADVEELVQGLCPSARLMESHEGRFLFQLPMLRAVGARAEELSLASLFLKMHEATRTIGLRDYSISRPSLEQVFLRLSKEQEELDGRRA